MFLKAQNQSRHDFYKDNRYEAFLVRTVDAQQQNHQERWHLDA